MSGTLLATETITGNGNRRPRLLGLIPYGSKTVEQPIDPDDSIGSLLICMDKVHQRGGGTCATDPKTIKSGKHNKIYRKYQDVIVTLK
jgi:hypothetical protein